MPTITDGSEKAKMTATRTLPTTERIGMASAASSASAAALMIPAAPPKPISIKAATMRPMTPIAMFSTPRTRTWVSI